MKKIGYFFMIAAAALVASCSLNIETDGQKADPSAVGFGVYVNRGVSTKAGWAGELTTATLKGEAGGFGVFAYYGDGALYNETAKPDFMYNQQVQFTSNNVWEYSPIKYWPNEFGAEAGSEAADRLTFFAYAPYVEVTPATGIVTAVGDDAEMGILGLTRNITAGDPRVMYGANFIPGMGVDLCWGVSADDFTSSVDGDNNNVLKGSPFIDVVKPKTGDKLSFEFNHALSQLNVTVDADIDVESHATSSLADQTKVYVRSVTFTGFATRGSLNLNSKAGNPSWFDISGTGRLRRDPVTVYDGRSDGLEGIATATDVNELPQGLNPVVIQSGVVTAGVTNTPVNLFNNADPDAPVMVVPISGMPVTVTICYDIETADPSLADVLSDGSTHGISIGNKITKTIRMDGSDLTLAAGKKYVISLHLGLTSVKFDAVVADWDNSSYTATADLPVNTMSLGSISLTDGSGNDRSDVTIWKNGTVDATTVTVLGSDGSDLTSKATLEWSTSNTDVAAVDASTGEVTIAGIAGSATITVKATYMERSITRSYTVNVNEVTGVSVSPASANVKVGNSVAITANYTSTQNGDYASLEDPAFSWSSSKPEFVTISSSSGTSVQAQGAASGSSQVTASINESYMANGAEASATCTVTCVSLAQTAYRGYEVSPGILVRNDDGSYGLTDGSNPFELANYYNKAESKNKYYFQWGFLKDDNELGADGNNINAKSTKLPDYPGGGKWEMPTGLNNAGQVWYDIIRGKPKSAIQIENPDGTITSLTGADTGTAFVGIEKDGTRYFGLLLLRDGSFIPKEGGLTHWGYTSAINEITYAQFLTLKDAGCLFLCTTGYFSSTFSQWRYFNYSGSEGKYWSASYSSGKRYYFGFANNSNPSVSPSSSSSDNFYIPVRLVKLMTD